MSRPEAKTEDKIIETWESSVPGTVWVWTYDRRDDRYKKKRVGGRAGSKRLHISRDDRKYNQEQVPVENQQLDPFTNGALRLVESATRDESLDVRYHYTDSDLAELFEIRDPAMFTEGISGIESELILRRLAGMGENVGTVAQNDALKELLRQRYPIGGTQKTVREMIAAGDAIGATRI